MSISRRHLLRQFSALALPATLCEAVQAQQAGYYATHPSALAFAERLQSQHHVPEQWTRSVLAQAQFLPRIQPLMLPPSRPGVRNWRMYRSRFVEPVRIRAGAAFWQSNARVLEQVARQTGVPAEIIVGIIGVETIYGRNVGNFRVLDTLSTLTFDFPAEHPRHAARQAYFEGELTQFLVNLARTGADPYAPVGSYAGAMGLPQFMPTSWAKFAVDQDGDGRIDLWHSAADAIGSVGNYLRAFGWQPALPTHWPVSVTPTAEMAALLEADILPSFSPAQLLQAGVPLPSTAQQLDVPLSLVALLNGKASAEYVVTTPNFYVITRYNWSAFYALAVIELGRAVAREMGVA